MKKIILILFLANSSFCMDKHNDETKKEPTKNDFGDFRPRMNPPILYAYKFDMDGKAIPVEMPHYDYYDGMSPETEKEARELAFKARAKVKILEIIKQNFEASQKAETKLENSQKNQ